jgi:preprotein translocase subunit SecE
MASAGIYKPGQGYYTRVFSAIGMAAIVAMGGMWLAHSVSNVKFFGKPPVYTQAAVFTAVLFVFGLIGYNLIGRKPRVVEFMIATESEMKKVNWSSKKEIVGSTWVVIGMTVFLAAFCFGFDRFYQLIFQMLRVLET